MKREQETTTPAQEWLRVAGQPWKHQPLDRFCSGEANHQRYFISRETLAGRLIPEATVMVSWLLYSFNKHPVK